MKMKRFQRGLTVQLNGRGAEEDLDLMLTAVNKQWSDAEASMTDSNGWTVPS